MNHYLIRAYCHLSNIQKGAKIILTSFVVLNFCVSTMSRCFTVKNEITCHYRRFNTEGRELTVRLTAPPPASATARDPVRHFANSVDELFEYSLRDLQPGDMVEISIHNADIQ